MDEFNDDCLEPGIFQRQKNQFIDNTVNYIKDWERMHDLRVTEDVFKDLHTFTSDLLQQIALEEFEVQEDDTNPEERQAILEQLEEKTKAFTAMIDQMKFACLPNT